MVIPNLTHAVIEENTRPQSLERGQDYFHMGAVFSVTQRQQTISSEVEGNEIDPYHITITFDDHGITHATCTCAYSFEGWCKHIVATLLFCLNQPEEIQERPSLNELLDQLNLVQTQNLIQALVENDPTLIEEIDFQVSRLFATMPSPTESSQSQPKQTTVDSAPFKRQVEQLLHDTTVAWENGWDDNDVELRLSRLVDEAMTFAERGEGNNALTILQGIIEGCFENWDVVSDYGLEPEDIDIDFDRACTEAILSGHFTEEEVLLWQEAIELWQEEWGSFAMALEALRQGWDYPPLLKVLSGETPEQRPWRGEPPQWAEDLSRVRLKILKQQERYEEYLRLAQAEGQLEDYLIMLTQLGQVEQVMTLAPTAIDSFLEAKALAETLWKQDYQSQALTIAQLGLELCFDPNDNDFLVRNYGFAVWTSQLAETIGDTEAALEARIIAFKMEPSFSDYERLEALADHWSDLRTELLQSLRETDSWRAESAKVNIFLKEGLIEDAIAIVSDLSSYHTQLIFKVMDQVLESHSQWVIDNAKARAESIIERSDAKLYEAAVQWLKRVQATYLAMNQESEWFRYREELLKTHGRKRKLMGLMENHKL
ncbi:MAG: SWIM zinc finger domain-containing protein [Cyanobacteria bacterium]|jgi:uncharacterized Zn finger protein|nr:SWIM zinc finger domain-containing protein [Cyanobacteria bacterium GSL.Bin21]